MSIFDFLFNTRTRYERDPAQEARDRDLDFRLRQMKEMKADGFKTLVPGWEIVEDPKMGQMMKHGEFLYPMSTASSCSSIEDRGSRDGLSGSYWAYKTLCDRGLEDGKYLRPQDRETFTTL